MTSPFDSFDFNGAEKPTEPAPGISNDDVIRVLSGRPKILSLMEMADTKKGVERVNENTADTGVVGYRDSKGQAVFTNVARNPLTNKEEKIGAPAAKAPIAPTTPTEQEPTKKPDTPLPVFNLLAQLRSSASLEEARGVYDTLQQGIVAERSRLEAAAFTFAEQKLGIPNMTAELDKARQADRADPKYLPGMGDSPITQKIQAELNALRGLADNEAKTFLTQNISYRAILTAEKTSGEEFKRHEQKKDREDQLDLTKRAARATAEINREANQVNRREDLQWREETELLQKYEGLNTAQLARLNILHSGDFANFSDIADDKQRKVKTMQLVLNKAKDKQFQEVMNAESDQQLLGYALQGNGQARKVAIANEAARRGVPERLVESEISELQRQLSDPQMAIKVLQKRMKPEEARATQGNMQASMLSMDPNKKLAATQERLTLLMEWSAAKRTEQFVGDVRSWNLTDPAFVTAVNKAVDVAGKADIVNVMTAYVDSATGAERLSRLAEFRNQLKNAAAKYQGSIFGEPDSRLAERLVVEEIANKGLFSAFARNVMSLDKRMQKAAVGNHRTDMASQGSVVFAGLDWGAAVVDAFLPEKKEIK